MTRAVLAGVLIAALLSSGQASAAPERRVFPDRTHDVLVFDDGYDGATFVDLDHRVAVRRFLNGRAGDQPYRLSRAGDALVVGWGEIYAAPLDGSPPRLLGESTFYIPAVEPGRVWLVDYPSGYAVAPVVRQVDLSGRVLLQRTGLGTPDVSGPIAGIPHGLAYQSSSGLVLWDATTGTVTRRLPGGFPVGVHGHSVVSCGGDCGELHVSTIGDGGVAIRAPRGTNEYVGYQGQFSPDGRWFAAIAGNHLPGTNGDTDQRVVLIDVRHGTVAAVFGRQRGTAFLDVGWSSDGKRLYFAADSYTRSRTLLGEYVLQSKTTHTTEVSFGGLLRFVVVSRDDSARMLVADIGAAAACPAPAIQPSGRSGGCGFRF